VILSGAGAGFMGAPAFISNALGLTSPAIRLPFLQGYNNVETNYLFHNALGILLSYINKKNRGINFLKGEFIPDINGKTKKIYSLALFFVSLTALVFIFNFIVLTAAGQSDSSRYEKLLGDNYLKYFSEKEVPNDPVASAKEKLRKEKKELDSITAIIGESSSSLELMQIIFSCFEYDPSFELKNFVINESLIRIDGSTASTQGINAFRNRLQQTGNFDSVSINITSAKSGASSFYMTIKKNKEETK
jgi:hypothetical protein